MSTMCVYIYVLQGDTEDSEEESGDDETEETDEEEDEEMSVSPVKTRRRCVRVSLCVCACVHTWRPKRKSMMPCLCVHGQDTRRHVRNCEGGCVHKHIHTHMYVYITGEDGCGCNI